MKKKIKIANIINIKILLISILMLSCSMKEKEVSWIRIKYVDFDILTFYAISCKDFEEYFKSEISSIKVYDKVKIKAFKKLYEKLEVEGNGYYPDVRMIIEIKYDDKTQDIICMSMHGIEVNNKPYKLTKEFFNFVNNLTIK